MSSQLKFSDIPRNEFQLHADRIRNLFFEHEEGDDGIDIHAKSKDPSNPALRTNYTRPKSDNERRPKATSWYTSAITMLREEIYRYGITIERGSHVDGLKAYIERRDNDREYRIAEPDVFDWTVRLVNVGKKEKSRLGRKRGEISRTLLFKEDATQTRLLAELRFAANFKIYWRYVGLFINAVGGYDVILRDDMLVDRLSGQNWINGLTRRAEADRRKGRKARITAKNNS